MSSSFQIKIFINILRYFISGVLRGYTRERRWALGAGEPDQVTGDKLGDAGANGRDIGAEV